MREVDPKVFGPGTWIVTHVLAMTCDKSKDQKEKTFFKVYVERMIHALPCRTCRRHACAYLRINPLIDYNGNLFEWTVKFHNSVNQRLGKPVVSLHDAYSFYENVEVILRDKQKQDSCKIDNSSGSTCTDN